MDVRPDWTDFTGNIANVRAINERMLADDTLILEHRELWETDFILMALMDAAGSAKRSAAPRSECSVRSPVPLLLDH
jgi:hypothetical protein